MWPKKRIVIIGSFLFAATATVFAGALPPTRAEFTTADGVTIVGDYYAPRAGAAAPAAILLPMYKHDRATWEPLVGPLHQAGFAVLAIDLRGHGESTKPADQNLAQRVEARDPELFNAMHADVAAAVDWVRRQPNVDPQKLVLVGASVGCSVALDYTARHGGVTAAVCLSPGEHYLGLDSVAHVAKTGDTPILLLATEAEREAVDTLSAKAKNAAGEIVGPGRIHGTNMFGVIGGIGEKIVSFVRKAALPTTGADAETP